MAYILALSSRNCKSILTALTAWLGTLLAFNVTFVALLCMDLITNCPDFIYNWNALVLMLVNDKLAYIELLGLLEHVDNILPILALLNLFHFGDSIE